MHLMHRLLLEAVSRARALPALLALAAPACGGSAGPGEASPFPRVAQVGQVMVTYSDGELPALGPAALPGEDARDAESPWLSCQCDAERLVVSISFGPWWEYVDVRLSLSVVIWLPTNATPQLKAHEEGHRALAEHYYKDAEQIARRHARPLVGRKIPIKATDLDAATRAEMEKVNAQLCDKVIAELEGPCAKAQDVYDEITDHGRKPKPTSEEAVKTSIERAGAKGK